jgi:hypothetical protein
MAETTQVTPLVDGYDAAFWNQSYRIVRDAVVEHLPEFVHEDDVAEEAIIVDTVEKAAARLAELTDFVRGLADTDGWSANEAQRRAMALIHGEPE